MVKSLGVLLVQGFFVHKPSETGVGMGIRPPILPIRQQVDSAKP
jgi:hypothetical protein